MLTVQSLRYRVRALAMRSSVIRPMEIPGSLSSDFFCNGRDDSIARADAGTEQATNTCFQVVIFNLLASRGTKISERDNLLRQNRTGVAIDTMTYRVGLVADSAFVSHRGHDSINTVSLLR